MSLHSPELGEALLDLPDPWAAGPQRMPAAFPAAVRERLSVAHAHARAKALAGEEIFRLAVTLHDSLVDNPRSPAGAAGTRRAAATAPGHDVSILLDALAVETGKGDALAREAALVREEAGSDAGDAGCADALRGRAVALVAAGDMAGAVAVLCVLLDWPAVRNDALLGLAICALRLKRHDEALALAREYLGRGGRHPRAHCIAGVCLLRRDERRAAQNHLAIAARAARSDAAFRDEMRAAQRLLIMLNFGR